MAKLKNDVPSWIAVLVVALTIIYSSGGNVLAQQPVSQKPDTTAISNTQIKQSESDSTKTPAQSELSNNSSKPASFFAGIKEWANENQGVLELIALMLTVLGGIIAFFKIILPRIGRNKKDSAKKGSAQKRYLDHLINAHQHLPVAGFETNLRIPISLEKVYVTLRARLTDWERAGGEELRTLSSQASADRDLKVQEALKLALKKEYHGMVILGHPGSGKTTLTKYFTLCFATSQGEKNLGLPEKLLPVLLFLREIDPQKTLIENLLAVLHKYDLGLDENFFKTYLEKGEAIVLLDGLDEVPTEEKRARVSRWIHHKAHLAFPNCPLIVTSRFSGYRGGRGTERGCLPASGYTGF